jgi:predicted membrane-bound spermidine synthase
MQSKNRGWIILALFFCSGATGLVYEVVWSKFLSEMLGSTIYAQTVVLAAFMGGLALGNRLFGRWADGLSHPVRAYGCLEILIGIYAVVFPAFDRAANYIFISLGTPIAERAGWLLLLKALLSVALLLGPTILMGGTLPLLAAWLQKSSPDAGRSSARFYSINTFGAVVGAALAGFLLVQHFGMIATLRIAAAVNIFIGIAAIFLSRAIQPRAESIEPAQTGPKAAAAATLRWAGLMVAITGGVSMGLELLASRSLALIFGSSLQSFAIVLMSFILGIGLGSAYITSLRRSEKSSERFIIVLLCIAAAWIAILVFNIERWVDFYRLTRIGLARNSIGYVYHLLLNSGISMIILGVPAACIGAVLPLMIRALSFDEAHLGEKVGWLLTWNTLGAVFGTLFTGFVLMPTAGLRNAFGILALTLAVVALFIAWRRAWRFGLVVPLAAIVISASIFFFGGEGWRLVMSSGIFRVRETVFIPNLMKIRKEQSKLLFYKDAADATVSVELAGGIMTPQSMGLRINGKADAGTDIDICNQLLLAHLPLLVKPDAKDVFVLGFGSGMTAGAVLSYPVNQVVVAENCDPVITAAKYFADWNRHVLQNPRTHLRREDARTVLKLSPQLYDVIITEPSNPWTVGVGSVFNKSFYDLAARRLKPGGIIAQWFHLYETEDKIVDLVLRTFSSVFPYVEIWDTGSGDMVILGSLHPWATGPNVFRKGFAIDRVKTDMRMIDIQSPEALMARQLASQQTGFAIAGPGPIQTDLFPILEYAAPPALYFGDRSRMLDRYDERTRQQLLAPEKKRALLHSLSLMNAQIVFNGFSTINGELYGCLFGNSLGSGVPCAFQTPNPAPPPDADGSLLSNAEQSFAAGNLDRAAQFAALALRQKPGDEQARYISRVIERKKELQQTTLKNTSQKLAKAN